MNIKQKVEKIISEGLEAEGYFLSDEVDMTANGLASKIDLLYRKELEKEIKRMKEHVNYHYDEDRYEAGWGNALQDVLDLLSPKKETKK